jgi:hypothetical protein
MLSHSEFEHALLNHGLASHSKYLAHRTAADEARKKKEDEEDRHKKITPENRARLRLAHDQAIEGHEKESAAWGNRSAAANAGFLLYGEQERSAEYKRDTHELLQSAQAYGRVIPKFPMDDEVEKESPCECDEAT